MSRDIVQFTQALVPRMSQVEALLPDGMSAKRFCRMAVSQVERNDKLQECTPRSFAMAVMACAELGLEPLLGMAYIIPYKTTATLQIGYQGMIQLARNSGQVLDLWADVVRENDTFRQTLGTSRSILHEPADGDRGAMVGVYAVAKLKGTTDPAFVHLTREEVMKRKAVSKTAARGGPWHDWEEEMWKKTAVRALYKYLPKSTQMQRAAVMDDDGAMGRAPQVITVDAVPEPVTIEPVDDEFFKGLPQEGDET